ncbi:MAG: CPBP family intramembrane metalloprotease [Butyrivibrio sp.]|nr:CPBP family intramembrane metalloprotease [Butyrivibrio sp.]
MKNWLKILTFTLKQAIQGSKFLVSTCSVGLVIFIIACISNIVVSGVFDEESQEKDVKAVYIVNETSLVIDTSDFAAKHQDEYPAINISEISGFSASEAASNSDILGEEKEHSIILDISEDNKDCNITVYIPGESDIGSDDAEDFAREFSDTIKDAQIKSLGVSEEKINMAINDLGVTEIIAEESDETEDTSLIADVAPMIVMMALYFMVIFYGQGIGQIISMEKTSKLMEYILTLTNPSGIIFGKVTAVFCEAVIQIGIWIACIVSGFMVSNVIIVNLLNSESKDIVALFMEMLPEGGVSDNFAVLMVMAIIALLLAFLFYCFVSALFASFAATAEELSQTNSMSLMTMLVGFIVTIYVPLLTDNSEIGMTIIRVIPFTAAFVLPGDIIGARIGLGEFLMYASLLLFFTIMLAVLAGRVYKNRLFKRGTKGIFAEIRAAITGKGVINTGDFKETEKDISCDNDIALKVIRYENYDKAKKTYTIIGFSLLALILGANVIGGLVGNIIANIMAAGRNMKLVDVYEDTTYLVITNIIGMYLIACPLCTLIMKLADDSVLKIKGHVSKNQYLRSIFIIFPVAISLSYFSNFLASVISGGESENTVINMLVTGDNILSMIMVAVLAPIFEELVFRKLIIDRTRRYGEVIAIIYSSLAFGLFHCNVYQIFYAFAIGLILGYIYVRTGNVILTIIMHMIMNSSSAVLYPLAPEIYKYFEYIMIILGICSIIYTIIKRDVKIERAKNEVSSNELTAIAFTNSGTMLFTIVCIFFMIYILFSPLLLQQ